MIKIILMVTVLIVILIGASCSQQNTIEPEIHSPPEYSPEPTEPVILELSEYISSDDGGELMLSDRAALFVPPGKLELDTLITFQKVATGEYSPDPQSEFISVGDIYYIDLGSTLLEEFITLNIPVDTDRLPSDVDLEQVFLSYFDEERSEWVLAGGEVDREHGTIILAINHSTWWQPAIWNWDTWITILDKNLSKNILQYLEAVLPIDDECPQAGEFVSVDPAQPSNLVHGCIVKDDAEQPELRVVNNRLFYYNVRQESLQTPYLSSKVLAPGKSEQFKLDMNDQSPLMIVAEITREAMVYLEIHMLLSTLPGMNHPYISGENLACIHDNFRIAHPWLNSAADHLLNQDPASAASELAHIYNEEFLSKDLIFAASTCGFDVASTWTLPGLRKIGGSLSTIMSAMNVYANFLTANSDSVLSFTWVQLNPGVPVRMDMARIGTLSPAYLLFDPLKWEAVLLDRYDDVFALEHRHNIGCRISQSFGLPHGPNSPEMYLKEIGDHTYQITLLRGTFDKLAFAGYYPQNFPTLLAFLILVGEDPDACIVDVEEVFLLSSDILWEVRE
jgi:hypothetical protein